MKKLVSLLLIILIFTSSFSVLSIVRAESIGAPSITIASNNNGTGILVQWDAVDGATGYVVYRRAMKTGETQWSVFARWNNTTGLSFLDTKVYEGTKYQYGVKAYYGTDPQTTTKLGAVGPMSKALVFSRKPGAPTVTTTKNTDAGIEVVWDTVSGASGYVIYRRAWSSTTGGWTAFERWNNTTDTTWVDSKVYAGSRYQYGVKAYYGNDPRAMAYVGAVGPLSTNVRITTRRIISFTSDENVITAKWDLSNAVTGYQMQYSENKDYSAAVIVTIGGKSSSSKSVSVEMRGTEYWTRIRGYYVIDGKTFYGAWSGSRSVKTQKNGTVSQNAAVQLAKNYLEIIDYSYNALIEQLEYEDVAHQDAVFAADYCGADWYYNAAQSAIGYLEYGISEKNLISQLEYDQFTADQARYGVDNCGADWFEQAVRRAVDYLDTMAFSEKGLISQLEYEQFTSEQAEYGVKNCNADWFEQAARMAKEYLEWSNYSREELIKQLIYEGFTYEQAVYGVDRNGLL